MSLVDRFINLLATLRAKWLIQRFRWTLRKNLTLVEVEVVPGKLTLKSFNPEQKHKVCIGDPNCPDHTEIEFERSFWDGKAHFPFWKKALTVSLRVFGTRPTDYQLRCLREMVRPHLCVRPQVDAALFEYYQREVYSKTWNPDRDTPLRQISCPRQIRKIVSSPTVSIDDKFDDDILRFTLTFDCDWNRCGAVIVTFDDWKLRPVGE